jgi:hypothetical protein
MNNNSQLIGTRVLYKGFNFSVEATIRRVATSKFGVTEILLETDRGICMWRGLGETSPLPPVSIHDAVTVSDPDGNVYHGFVTQVVGEEISVFTEDETLVDCHRVHVVRVSRAAVQKVG